MPVEDGIPEVMCILPLFPISRVLAGVAVPMPTLVPSLKRFEVAVHIPEEL